MYLSGVVSGETNWDAAAVGAGYQFTRDATANLRQKNDIYNEAIGGFVGGTVVGLARTCSCYPPWSMANDIREEHALHTRRRCLLCYRHVCVHLH